ncbi:hypothetical protein EZV62_009207 [Acer yangbiense]|uniref:Premnaspirodiene oxygenase-like n=1 Tax=Acer yangbiense TaxID=1000413 RepID=A0A5C7IGE8_9ROSI|nr:hypothetical protein EZV62_009207 [Acer yangbiense]
MEYQFPFFTVLLTFLIFIFMILRLLKKSKTNLHSTLNLPPGPWKLPVIGNMHLLVGSLPHFCFGDLAKKYGSLMHLQLGEVSHIVISSPETAKQVMKIHDISFAQRPRYFSIGITTYNFTDIAFAPYGDYWRQMRKICTLELLSAKRVQSFRSIREEEVSILIKYLASTTGGLPINFSKMLVNLTNDITSRAAFGRRCEDREAFLHAVQKTIELVGGFSVADLFPSVKFLEVLSGMRSKLLRHREEMDKILENIIDEHRAASKAAMEKASEDEAVCLLDVLLDLQDQGDLELPLTRDNINAVITDIFAAGSETTSTTMEWAISEMLKNPRVMEKAQAEVRQVFSKKGNVDETGLHKLQYLKLVIKESLRLHPPLPLILPRECRESCKINGYDIPVGSKVIVNAWAIGRDPDYWTEAESFHPERFLDSSIDYRGTDFELIPFGAGRRICPGLSFGIANAELPLAQLLYHFDWKLPDGMKNQDIDMTETFGVTARRKNDLYLIPTLHHPLPIE